MKHNVFNQLVLIIIINIIYTQKLIAQKVTNSTKNKIEIQAEYPGGMDAFRKYISENIRYSILSQITGKNAGEIKIKFTIDTLGNLINPTIEKSIDKYYAQEALRVVKASQKWTPGKVDGKKVNVKYTLPIKIVGSKIDLKNANAVLNAGTIKPQDLPNKLLSTFTPYYIYDSKFSTSLFGSKYNKPLVVIQDFNENMSNPKEFALTLKNLKQIDSTKFNLAIDESEIPYHKWIKNLNMDSTENILIYENQVKNDKLGKVILLTKDGNKRYKNSYFKNIADKQTFLDLIHRYRTKQSDLPNKLIYIDNYHYNTNWIMDSINTNIVHTVVSTNPEAIQGHFEDDRRNGYYQIFTKDYTQNQEDIFRQRLDSILKKYQENKSDNTEFLFFVNNSPSSISSINDIDPEDILLVHMISKERAKDIFGTQQEKPIIYIYASE